MRQTIQLARLFSLLAAVISFTVVAEPNRAEVPRPPEMSSKPYNDELEPTVTIKTEGDREVEEYRVRGRLFAMRVKVKGAPPYWLIDMDGSGRMVPGQGIGPTISVPKWVITEF